MKVHRICCAVAISVLLGGLQVRLASQSTGSSATECTVAAVQAKAPQRHDHHGRRGRRRRRRTCRRYCRVDGHVAVPGNEVNFRLGLPNAWNGKFYFVGVGGLGGSIGSLNAGLTRGYASASTDTGHESTIRPGARTARRRSTTAIAGRT